MFRLIESISSDFIRFQPVGKEIKPGNIVQTISISGDIFVELSDGSRSFGFCGEIEDNWVKIYNQHMICRTSVFDRSCKYLPGSCLYVKDGILTTIKPNPLYYSVGNVITDFRPKRNELELNWI